MRISTAPAELQEAIGLEEHKKFCLGCLLGSWLLRIAQLYGLGLTTLLSRLGALPACDGRLPHWFASDGSGMNCDALFAASRLPQATLATMTPSPCKPRWLEQLGACEKCLAAATDAGEPITWNRRWMKPLITVCSIHGSWLTPVATRKLARVRHAGDLDSVVRHIAAAQALPDYELARASDALWLQDLCTARTTVPAPRGAIRQQDLIRIVDAAAREVIAASDSGADPLGLPASRRQGSVKNFAFEICNGERVGVALPTQLRQRQRVMASVAHVLLWPTDERAYFSSWSAASIVRLASMRNESEVALAWICPVAADLVRQQDAFRRQFSILPRYFKACAALFASIRGSGQQTQLQCHQQGAIRRIFVQDRGSFVQSRTYSILRQSLSVILPVIRLPFRRLSRPSTF